MGNKLRPLPCGAEGPAKGNRQWAIAGWNRRAARQEAAPATQQAAGDAERDAWKPIESAPKDGSHFLACVEPRGGFNEHQGFNQYPPAEVHWFGYPEDAAGFYLSRTLVEQTKPDEYTHWRPIPRWLES